MSLLDRLHGPVRFSWTPPAAWVAEERARAVAELRSMGRKLVLRTVPILALLVGGFLWYSETQGWGIPVGKTVVACAGFVALLVAAMLLAPLTWRKRGARSYQIRDRCLLALDDSAVARIVPWRRLRRVTVETSDTGAELVLEGKALFGRGRQQRIPVERAAAGELEQAICDLRLGR